MTPNALAIDDLRFTYHDGPEVLKGVSLRVAPGEAVGLLGPNGSGKSTLLRLLVGLLRGEGRIAAGGIELSRENLPELRRRVGLVFQDPDAQLFMPTLLDDVMFGPLNGGMARAEARRRAEAALARVDLAPLAGRSAHHLSGGERRRAALAAVLAMAPPLLLLDEPSSDLDPRGRRRLIELLAGLGETRLIATHDLDLVWDLCPRVVILEGGRIAADGPAETILRDGDLLRRHGLDLPLSLQPRARVEPLAEEIRQEAGGAHY